MKLTDVIEKEYENVNPEIVLKPKSEINLFEITKILFDHSSFHQMNSSENSEMKEWENCIELLTPKIITEISVLLGAYSEVEEMFGIKNYIGPFLSRLVNTHHRITGDNDEYVIITEHMPNVSLLCWYNSANVCIQGNAGLNCCRNMEGGSVRILGNCGEKLGEEMTKGAIFVDGSCDLYTGANMINGSILINGNCGSYAGCNMNGGNLTIKGNADPYLGWRMKGGRIDISGTVHKEKGHNRDDLPSFRMSGGEIHLHGDYEEDSLPICTLKGRIYHKEKCITPYHKRLYESVKAVFTNR